METPERIKLPRKMGRLKKEDNLAKQEKCLEAISRGEMNKEEICLFVNISRPTLDKWLENENFLKQIDKRRNKSWAFYMPKIDKSLRNIAFEEDKNSVSAIRTVYEKRGEINGAEVKQPITIVFESKQQGLIKRSYVEAKDITEAQCPQLQ